MDAVSHRGSVTPPTQQRFQQSGKTTITSPRFPSFNPPVGCVKEIYGWSCRDVAGRTPHPSRNPLRWGGFDLGGLTLELTVVTLPGRGACV